jgi:ATP-dependent helicase HrpB
MVIRARDPGRGFDACTVAALLDGPPLQNGPQSTDIDLATVVHGLTDRTGDRAARLSVHGEAERLRRLLGISLSKEAPAENYGPLLALAYPDRIARRREAHGRKYLLANGTGAQLPEWSLLARAEFLAVGEVDNAGVDARGDYAHGRRSDT